MFIEVRVVEYDTRKDNGAPKATGRGEQRIINCDYIVTWTNKKVPNSDSGTCDVCTMGLVTGETIDVYGRAKFIHYDKVVIE